MSLYGYLRVYVCDRQGWEERERKRVSKKEKEKINRQKEKKQSP